MAPFEVGLITIWDDAVAVHQPDILVKAKAVELAKNQGVFWNALRSPSVAIIQKSFQIYGRSLTTLNATIGTGAGVGWVDGAATADLPMNAAAVNKLTVGCVILVESEVVIIKAVNVSAATIDVWSRGAGGTAGAAHVDTTAYAVIQYAAHDTDLKNVTSRAEITNKYLNYVNMVFETIDHTVSQELLGREGIGTGKQNVSILKQEAMNRIASILSISCLRGVKQAGAKATDPYASAGLYSQLEDTAGGTRPILRYNASAAVFSEAIFRAALREAFKKGNPDTAWMSPGYKDIANTFKQSYITSDAKDTKAGYSVSSYEYEGKTIDIKVDQDCQDTKLAIVTQSKCQKGWQKGELLRFVEEPAASSREKRDSLQGSVGIIIEGVGYDHIEIYGLASA
jgi:hypothetical protein